jgi:hypothetical protein
VAIEVYNQMIPVRYCQDEETGGLHLQHVEKAGDLGLKNEKTLAAGAIEVAAGAVSSGRFGVQEGQGRDGRASSLRNQKGAARHVFCSPRPRNRDGGRVLAAVLLGDQGPKLFSKITGRHEPMSASCTT